MVCMVDCFQDFKPTPVTATTCLHTGLSLVRIEEKRSPSLGCLLRGLHELARGVGLGTSYPGYHTGPGDPPPFAPSLWQSLRVGRVETPSSPLAPPPLALGYGWGASYCTQCTPLGRSCDVNVPSHPLCPLPGRNEAPPLSG